MLKATHHSLACNYLRSFGPYHLCLPVLNLYLTIKVYPVRIHVKFRHKNKDHGSCELTYLSKRIRRVSLLQ